MTKHASPPMKTPETKPTTAELDAAATMVNLASGKPDVDKAVLHAALARLARLLGYQDEHSPDHVGDIDATGVSEKYAGIVAFAKVAKLP